MVHVPEDWEVAEPLSPSGDTADDGEDASSQRGRDLETSHTLRGDGGGGTAGDRNLRRLSP